MVNLEECLALTHNYVSTSNLGDVLHFLRDKTDQISGVRDRCVATAAAVDGEEEEEETGAAVAAVEGAVEAVEGAVSPAEMHALFVERLRSVLTSACLEACINQSNRSSPHIIQHQHQRGGVVASLRSRRRCMKAKRRHVMTRGGGRGSSDDDGGGDDDSLQEHTIKRAVQRDPTTTTTHNSGGLFLFDFKLE